MCFWVRLLPLTRHSWLWLPLVEFPANPDFGLLLAVVVWSLANLR